MNPMAAISELWVQFWAQPAVQLIAFASVAGLISAAWAVITELVSQFEAETGRALQTGGARLLLAINFVAAATIFLVVATNLADANYVATALVVGVAWPVVIRNMSIKLAQPIQSDDLRNTAVVRVEEAYAGLQSLSLRLINTVLTRERMRLINRATEVNLSVLETKARNALIASPKAPAGDGAPDAFVDKIMAKAGAKEEIKKAYLAALILEHYDRRLLEEMIKEARTEAAARDAKSAKPGAGAHP